MDKDNQIDEPQVSVFKKITQTTGGETYPLADVLNGIKQGNWRDKVEQYRLLPEDTKEEQEFKKQSKLSLPNFTGSGTFESKRKAKEITQHNGRIFIDFDAVKFMDSGKRSGCIEDGKLDEVCSLICADEYTEYGFVSVGGKGFVAVVKIDGERHLESFRALQAYYKNKYGYDIDESCSDTSRPRFVSYYPNLFHNPNFTPFIIGRDYVAHVKNVVRRMIEGALKGEVHNTLIRASRLMGGYIAGELIGEEEGEEHLIELMRVKPGVVSIEIERKKIRDGINNGKQQPIYAEQLREAEAINDKKDEIIKEIYSYIHLMNRRGEKWNDSHVVLLAEKYCNDISLSKADIQRIFKQVFDENKDEFGIDEKPEIKKVEVYLSKHYEFMYNEVTETAMYRIKGAIGWKVVNEDSLYRELQHVGFNFVLSKLSSLLKSDFVPIVNPFKEYFENLPKWDWETDYIGQLADFIQTENPQFFKDQLRKALVRCVGCSIYGAENRMVVVLVGRQQETGKSTFIRFLNPFGKEYYTEAPLYNNKDTSISLAENFIYNLEELEELNKTDLNRLKAMISSWVIKERGAYARKATARLRRCNFFASTNKDEFLTDINNSRWLCFNVTGIDWSYKQKIDIDKVWAEAFALYHDSEYSCQLTAEEKQMRMSTNKSYETNPLEKELIRKLFRPCVPLEGVFMTNSDILQALINHWPGLKSTTQAIGSYMSQLGFARRHTGSTRGWFVLKTEKGSNDTPDSGQTNIGDGKTPKLF